ncbi:MAG: hypothetical protein L0H53_00770 [Candidatus Nitrosocosmicus sp.]|nr:hypothetical protein [Candidatus Nitrosocosmicus sp.]MDN5865950.1 hypothetical protein [Candidatus Nitrosocosmicus sp.]
MSGGAPFAADELVSAAKLNRKTSTLSDNISAETPLPGQIFINQQDNGSFLEDDAIFRSADNLSWKFLSMQKHTHDSDTHKSGGLLRDIFTKNLSNFLYFNKRMGMSGSEFAYIVSSGNVTGALDLTSGALKFDTSANANEYLTGVLMGIPLTFTKYSVAETDMQFTGNITNQFARFGINMESMNISNNSTAKYGIESCAATNGNWFVVSADGSSRTQQDSLKPLLGGGSQKTYRIENIVGSSIDFTYSTDQAVSKATNLPTVGSTPKNNILSFGIKTTDTNSKQLFIWGLSMIGES